MANHRKDILHSLNLSLAQVSNVNAPAFRETDCGSRRDSVLVVSVREGRPLELFNLFGLVVADVRNQHCESSRRSVGLNVAELQPVRRK